MEWQILGWILEQHWSENGIDIFLFHLNVEVWGKCPNFIFNNIKCLISYIFFFNNIENQELVLFIFAFHFEKKYN